MSRVQRMRKEAGFAVSDRITLTVAGEPEVKDVIDAHGAWIAEEVLATELVFVEQGGDRKRVSDSAVHRSRRDHGPAWPSPGYE